MYLLKKLDCRIYSTVAQAEDPEAWLKIRTGGIGGSDVGAICGVSSFSSARQIYLKKTGQYQEGMGEATTSEAAKERMHFGHMLEPVVADEYARRTGKRVEPASAILVHKEFDWALANVDRIILDEKGDPIGILECKTSSEYMDSDWSEGDVMTSYIYQLQWYLWITGLKQGAIAVLVGGNKFYYYDVFFDSELIYNEILPKVQKFWFENVKNLKEPELQASDTDFAKEQYADVVKGSEVDLVADGVANELAQTVVNVKAQIKELESILDESQNRLKDRLQDKEIGYTSDFIVKWSPRSRSDIDRTMLKKEYPDAYEACQKKTTYRVMSIKGGL